MKQLVKGYKIDTIYNLNSNEIDYLNRDDEDKSKLEGDCVYSLWIRPEIIYVIEITNYIFSKGLIDLINELGVKHIIIIIESKNRINFLNFLKDLEGSEVNTIKLILNYLEEYYSDTFADFIFHSKKISIVIVYNSPFEKNFDDRILFYSRKIQRNYIKDKFLFQINYELFSESQAHHTYFNRKLYIGPNGEIKNAPECEETFGYIQDLESPEQLKEIVQTPEFQKYWYVHKEITDVCKDCEFRHMCVDNRLPYQRAENEWYHKQECNYNPYIAKWKGEEGYRTLAECGVVSNENGFSIDHDKIAKINEELWGES